MSNILASRCEVLVGVTRVLGTDRWADIGYHMSLSLAGDFPKLNNADVI